MVDFWKFPHSASQSSGITLFLESSRLFNVQIESQSGIWKFKIFIMDFEIFYKFAIVDFYSTPTKDPPDKRPTTEIIIFSDVSCRLLGGGCGYFVGFFISGSFVGWVFCRRADFYFLSYLDIYIWN